MVIRYYILGFVSLLLCSCYAPTRDCTNFKTGTFEFETYLNGEISKTTFTRNDSLEIDYFKSTADSSSIRWINDCEYIARKINPQSYSERKALHFKIINTTESSYTFEYSIVGETNKQKGKAFKIDNEIIR